MRQILGKFEILFPQPGDTNSPQTGNDSSPLQGFTSAPGTPQHEEQVNVKDNGKAFDPQTSQVPHVA